MKPLKVKVVSKKKGNNFESPNVNKLLAVIIDNKTTIYIASDADPSEAKNRYLNRINSKKVTYS